MNVNIISYSEVVSRNFKLQGAEILHPSTHFLTNERRTVLITPLHSHIREKEKLKTMEEYIIETSETLEQEEEAMAAPPKRKRNREPDPDSWLKNQRKKMRCW